MNELPEGYTHRVVNHSEEWVTAAGDHTNTIEATWHVLKAAVPVRKRNKKHLQLHLYEKMWREHNLGGSWDSLMHALRIGVYDIDL